jgi:hypothetical protein
MEALCKSKAQRVILLFGLRRSLFLKDVITLAMTTSKTCVPDGLETVLKGE